jgi:hypothetical protein
LEDFVTLENGYTEQVSNVRVHLESIWIDRVIHGLTNLKDLDPLQRFPHVGFGGKRLRQNQKIQINLVIRAARQKARQYHYLKSSENVTITINED